LTYYYSFFSFLTLYLVIIHSKILIFFPLPHHQ
jgi:hypothetical protein